MCHLSSKAKHNATPKNPNPSFGNSYHSHIIHYSVGTDDVNDTWCC